MNSLTRLLLAVACVLCWGLSASAQTVATTTTLAADLTATATTMTVTSATGFTVGNQVYIDAEQMQITSISGTAIGIRRGLNGTAARAHDNAERIITGAADHFHTNPPDYGADCARGVGQAAYSPWIDVRGAIVYMCGASGGGGTAWTATTTLPLTLSSIPTSF